MSLFSQKPLRIDQLRALAAIHASGSFAAASKSLDLSTPSVWNQIRSLEQRYDIPLVSVVGHRVSLTAEGIRLLNLAHPIVLGFDGLDSAFAGDLLRRQLRLAAPGNVFISELPECIRDYRSDYPDVELKLMDAGSSACFRMVAAGEVDLGVAGRLDPKAFPTHETVDWQSIESGLLIEPILSFAFGVIFPEDHPLSSATRITPATIARYPLVAMAKGTNSRQRLDNVMRLSGKLPQMRIAFETNTKESLLEYVRLGFGIAVAPLSPAYYRRDATAAGRLVGLSLKDVSPTFGYEEIVAILPAHRHTPKHIRDFVQRLIGPPK
jgi:molybdate transport repressor ModE-like protein